MIRFSLLTICLAAFILLVLTRHAYAYIDMGTGSMVFQMLMAGAVGAFFTIKSYWLTFKKKTHRFYCKLTGKPLSSDDDAKS